MKECPEWMRIVLGIAMDHLVKNHTLMIPGEHHRQFDGFAVTQVAPTDPGDPFIVRSKDYSGTTWQYERTQVC